MIKMVTPFQKERESRLLERAFFLRLGFKNLNPKHSSVLERGTSLFHYVSFLLLFSVTHYAPFDSANTT